jgi:Ferritin-like domain
VDTERLHRLAEEADAEHRAAMRTFEEDLAVRVFEAGPDVRANRRRFVRNLGLGAGAALVSIPLLARVAAAQETTTTTLAGNAGGTPPKSPTTEDKVVLGWAQSVELAAVEAYKAAIATGKLTADVAPVAALFGDHHRQHAQAHAALAGKAALNTANQSILAEFGPLIVGANNQTELLQVAHQLELTAAATYVWALGELQGTDGAASVASIVPTEARHAAVFASVLGLKGAEATPAFIEAADGLQPSDYPIIAG